MNKNIIVYVEYDTLYSNVNYPIEQGAKIERKLDPNWVKKVLMCQYGVYNISNKYAVEVIFNNQKIIITNYNDKFYEIIL